MHARTDDHWTAVKRILRYLQATTTYGLHITRESLLTLHGFTNADWAGSIDDQKSTGGYLVYLGSTPVSWKSGKQRTVARSSTESEYKALANGTAEILWICSLLAELRISTSSMTTLWYDNLEATFLSAIRYSTLVLNMLKLIIILSVIVLLREKFKYDSSLQRINLRMFLPSLSLQFHLLILDPSFG